MQPYHHIAGGCKFCTEKGNFAHWTIVQSHPALKKLIQWPQWYWRFLSQNNVAMFGSHGILNKQLNDISKEKPNFWTMKQEKRTLIQYSTVNSQICLITGSWSNLVNEKPSITILFFAKPAPGISGWFYCLDRGISERHGSSLDPRATWPWFLQGSTWASRACTQQFVSLHKASSTRAQGQHSCSGVWPPQCHHPKVLCMDVTGLITHTRALQLRQQRAPGILGAGLLLAVHQL